MSDTATSSQDVHPQPQTLSALIYDVSHSENYLGNPDILTRAEWHPIDNSKHQLLLDNDGELEELEAEFVGELSRQFCRLSVCGSWTSSFTSPFSATKATAIVVQPLTDVDDEDWKALCSNVNKIQASKVTKGSGGHGNVIVQQSGLKIRHALFEKHTPTERTPIPGTRYQDDVEAGPDIFHRFSKWPLYCKSSDAAKAMEDLLDTREFVPQPIPAYDRNGEQIPPESYEFMLAGAIAHVKVAVIHQILSNPKRDNYYLDVRELQVVRAPIRIKSIKRVLSPEPSPKSKKTKHT